jgi:hypothetical protein
MDLAAKFITGRSTDKKDQYKELELDIESSQAKGKPRIISLWHSWSQICMQQRAFKLCKLELNLRKEKLFHATRLN